MTNVESTVYGFQLLDPKLYEQSPANVLTVHELNGVKALLTESLRQVAAG
jgi:hypothetical protein